MKRKQHLVLGRGEGEMDKNKTGLLRTECDAWNGRVGKDLTSSLSIECTWIDESDRITSPFRLRRSTSDARAAPAQQKAMARRSIGRHVSLFTHRKSIQNCLHLCKQSRFRLEKWPVSPFHFFRVSCTV